MGVRNHTRHLNISVAVFLYRHTLEYSLYCIVLSVYWSPTAVSKVMVTSVAIYDANSQEILLKENNQL